MRSLRRTCTWLCAGLALGMASRAHAVVYYVDNRHASASDSNSGQLRDQPWRTITKATSLAGPGDEVRIYPGVYREQFKPPTAGTSAQLIRFVGMGATPDDVVITAYDPLTSTIAKTANRTNVWQFAPGVMPTGIHEAGKPTEYNLLYIENGSDPYWKYTKNGRSDECLPSSLSDGLAMVDGTPGSYYQDSPETAGVFYFHPFNNANPGTLQLEIEMRDYAGYVAKDYISVQNLSFWGGAQSALILSGDGTKADKIRVYNGQLALRASSGMTNLVLSNFKAMGGLDVRGSDGSYPGLIVRDGEARGNRSNTVAVQRVSGTPTGPVRIQNVFSHNGWGQRFRNYGYNCYTGDWDAGFEENRMRGAHGIYVGDSTMTPFITNVYVDGNIVARQYDGIGLFNCNSCRIWNNTLGDDNGTMTSKPQVIQFAGVNNLDIRNNLIYRESGDLGTYGLIHLNLSTAATDTFVSNYNLVFHPTIAGQMAEWKDLDDSVYTLAQAKSRGLEGANSAEVASGSTYFVNPQPGVNDYGLLAGSPAIDRGDATRCPWTKVGTACEIGAREFGTASADTTAPGQISTLVASTPNSTAVVQLAWTDVSDDGGSTGAGAVSAYQARYARAAITTTTWSTATAIDTSAWVPLAPGAAHVENIDGLTAATTFFFAVRAVDEAGNVGPISNVPSVTTGSGTPPPPSGLERTDTR